MLSERRNKLYKRLALHANKQQQHNVRETKIVEKHTKISIGRNLFIQDDYNSIYSCSDGHNTFHIQPINVAKKTNSCEELCNQIFFILTYNIQIVSPANAFRPFNGTTSDIMYSYLR